MSEIEILFQDSDILCINKPSGLLSIPDGYLIESPYVQHVLEPKYGKLWIVHRLDRNTSGVMLLARNKEAHRLLNLQFQDKRICKKYRAIVLGNPIWHDTKISAPLLVNGDRKHRTVISSSLGKAAETRCVVLSVSDGYVMLEAMPYNGYTHQIRAHLAYCGFPILSDLLYQRDSEPSTAKQQMDIISRTALHAASIEFIHPANNSTSVIDAPPPQDFLRAINICGL